MPAGSDERPVAAGRTIDRMTLPTGHVSVDELYDYLYDRVGQETPHQTPTKWWVGQQGRLYLARNPHPPPPAVTQEVRIVDPAEGSSVVDGTDAGLGD